MRRLTVKVRVTVTGRAAAGLLCAGLALSGCRAPETKPVSYRDASVRQSVILRGGAEQLQGGWTVRAGAPKGVRGIGFDGDQIIFMRSACDASGLCRAVPDVYAAEELSQNRWQLSQPGTPPFELLVLWVDEGFRTAALAARDGSFAYIVDREATGGADRIKAAREMLEFNGYDIAALEPL